MIYAFPGNSRIASSFPDLHFAGLARLERLGNGLNALANLSGHEGCTPDQMSALLAILADEAAAIVTIHREYEPGAPND